MGNALPCPGTSEKHCERGAFQFYRCLIKVKKMIKMMLIKVTMPSLMAVKTVTILLLCYNSSINYIKDDNGTIIIFNTATRNIVIIIVMPFINFITVVAVFP